MTEQILTTVGVDSLLADSTQAEAATNLSADSVQIELLVDSVQTDSVPSEALTALLAPADSSTYTLPGIESLLPPDTTLFYSAIPLQGEIGTLPPYSVSADNAITLLFLSAIVLMLVTLARQKWFIVAKTREFFLTTHNDDYDVLTASVSRYLPLLLLNSLLLGVGLFIVAGRDLPSVLQLPPIAIVVVLAVVLLLYLFLKYILYGLVNNVFFGSKKNVQWGQAFLYVTVLEGLIMLPLIVMMVYYDVPAKITTYYCLAVLFFIKILTFYKCWSIFFRQNGRYLENILYFCALEITPLFALGGLWVMIANMLKVNF